MQSKNISLLRFAHGQEQSTQKTLSHQNSAAEEALAVVLRMKNRVRVLFREAKGKQNEINNENIVKML